MNEMALCSSSSRISERLTDEFDEVIKLAKSIEELESVLRHLRRDEICTSGTKCLLSGLPEDLAGYEGRLATVLRKKEKAEGDYIVRVETSSSDVDGEGKEIVVSFENLCCDSTSGVVEKEEDYAGGASKTGAKTSGDEKSLSYFLPGSSFAGKISVPGMEDDGSIYKVSVLMSQENAFEEDSPVSLLRHQAYGDAQVCHVRDAATSSDKSIEYSDQETHCTCKHVDVKKKSIIGVVRQLLNPHKAVGEGEFFHKGKATHTFSLAMNLCSTNPRYRSTNLRIRAIRRKRIEAAVKWSRVVRQLFTSALRTEDDDYTETFELAMSQLRKLSAKEILADFAFECERTCALVRKYADIFSRRTHASQEAKQAFLSRVTASRWNRKGVHERLSEASEAYFCFGSVLLSAASLVGIDLSGATTAHYANLAIDFRRHFRWKRMRMDVTYRTFDIALKLVEQRIPTASYQAWREAAKAEEEKEKEDGAACVICMCELERKDALMKLPCGHCFHEHCLEGWLKDHKQCPTCRHALS